MMRSMWIALVIASAPACSLDLDRLRAGAGIDAGVRDDAGDRVDGGGGSDAGARDDAGEPDAGACGCAGGGWQKTPFVVGGSGVSHVSLADLDGDLDLDVVASRRGGLASLLRMSLVGCGRENLTTTADEIEDTLPDTIVALVDWNGDGVLDLAAPNPGPGSLRTFTGNVSGARYSLSWAVIGEAKPSISAAANAFALDLGGGDVDGIIALASDRAVVLLWRDDIATPHDFITAGTATDAAFGAMTAAGALGAIAEGTAGVELVLLDPDGEPPVTGSTESIAYEAGMDIADVHFVDVDADGDEDLVAVDVGRGILLTYLREAGAFGKTSRIGSAEAIAVTSGDVSGDSRPELITVSEARGQVYIHEWSGAGWSSPGSVSVSSATSIAVGDVDADGQNDLVVGHAEGSTGQVTVVRRVCP